LIEKEITLPVSDPNKTFRYEDIGITYPTITVTSDRKPKQIEFDPTSTEETDAAGPADGRGGVAGADGGGMGMGLPGAGGPGASGSSDIPGAEDKSKTTFDVFEYNFVVQMAWTPRTEKQILEARAARLKVEKEKADAAAEAAGETVAVEEN
jgi:hypothetical protein